MPICTAPWYWASTMPRLIARPTSATARKSVTATRPVAQSTSTSANCTEYEAGLETA